MPDTFVPSRYQADFFDALARVLSAGTGDLMLGAVAGAGKTKTITEACLRLPLEYQRSCFLTAFNKHIQTELVNRQRAGQIPQGIRISTIHGLGFRILADRFRPADRRTWVDEYKYRNLLDIYWREQQIPADPAIQEEAKEAKAAAEKVCRLAMLTLTDPTDRVKLWGMCLHYGIEIPARFGDMVVRAVEPVLRWGREGLPSPDEDGKTYHPSQAISFDDMVYLPVALDLPVPQFRLCFIDEAQDFNAAQLELLLRARGDGIAIWVGDERQAIYGFTGADCDSFRNIEVRTGALRLPLSICYRCAQSIVRLAREIVPSIEAAPDAPAGTVVTDLTEDQVLEMAAGHYRRTPRDPFLILCRVNAPLIAAAFDLIRRGVPARVKGRDIGQQLTRALDAMAKVKGFSFLRLPEYCEHWRKVKLSSLIGREGTEMQQAAVNDWADSVLAVYEAARLRGATDVGEMRAYIANLFTDEDGGIVLSSIHKAKGLESRRVGILRPDLIPHPMARQDWEQGQERNLAYVAVTRAREELLIAGTWQSHLLAGPSIGLPLPAPSAAAAERVVG